MVRRARAWRTAALEAICDVLEPWECGTIARATRYPSYYNFNLVRMERDAAVSVPELLAVAERALDGLAHRRVDIEVAGAAERLSGGFEAAGWRSSRVVWMRHETEPAAGPEVAVEPVPYDEVHPLRVLWHREEMPTVEPGAFFGYAREVALTLGARVLAVRARERPVAFAQIERHGHGVEISEVYVHPDHRGHGLGTAVTRAAVRQAGRPRDLWISADDEGRPKNLYARLGFRAVCTTLECTRLP
jgi:GNAT superfamily N-acetyltransferase